MKKEIVERLEGFLTQKGSVILELNRQEAIDVLQSHQKLKDAFEDLLKDRFPINVYEDVKCKWRQKAGLTNEG